MQSMAARGPDHAAVRRFGPVILGHGRLAIRGLTSPAALQPMETPDGRHALVFNGEIYNHAEIADILGFKPRSGSDTEVLLELLARRGVQGLALVEGDFALAHLDRSTGELILARDLFGVKPLCYVETDGGFWFASVPQALLSPAGPALRVADEAAVAAFLVEGLAELPGRTFFRDVKSVLPGHALVVRDGRVVRAERYAPCPVEGPARMPLEAALAKSVALRLEADVPVGASLSGGLDSAFVVATATRGRAGLPTFTALMPDGAPDESGLAALTAAASRASPTWVYVGPPSPDELRALVRDQGAPFSTLSVHAQRRVAAAARAAGAKVLLDGQGADEVFAGYPHYRAARLATLLARGRLARFAREARACGLASTAEAFYLILPRPVRDAVRRVAHRRARKRLDPGLAARHPLPRAPGLRGSSLLKAVLADGLRRSSLPSLLRFADRNTMAEGVEGRYPFLDRDVVAAAFALEDERLVSDNWTKRALREAAAGLVPDAIRSARAKVDFRTPDEAWFAGPLARLFEEHLGDGRLEERGWLAPGEGARLLADHARGRDKGMARRAFFLEAWARVHLDAPQARIEPGALRARSE